ncbi:MAG TPA: biotin/lipoyl-binding protein, partial [Armatimonadota bacterium]
MSWVIQNKSKALILAAILVAVVLIAVISARRHHPAEETAQVGPAVEVQSALVQNMESPILRESPGTVMPRTESDVAAKIMSTVSVIYVREGDRVSAGQVLIRLEASDLAAQEAQAAAELQASRSR